MDNKEVNDRIVEVYMELEEMRAHWVEIYNKVIDLINITDEERED